MTEQTFEEKWAGISKVLRDQMGPPSPGGAKCVAHVARLLLKELAYIASNTSDPLQSAQVLFCAFLQEIDIAMELPNDQVH